MDNAGRISQAEHHAALDRRDKRIAKLEAHMRRIYSLLDDGEGMSYEAQCDLAHDIAAEALGLKDW